MSKSLHPLQEKSFTVAAYVRAARTLLVSDKPLSVADRRSMANGLEMALRVLDELSTGLAAIFDQKSS